jgi:predicted GNAT family N-acyltransferase
MSIEQPDSKLIIEILDKNKHNRRAFSCGNTALDTYLQRQAAQDMERHAAVVYVALIEDSCIAGYYTLSQFGVDVGELPASLSKRLPRYPIVPATLLGRLAVASAFQGQRLGEALLFDALRRALDQSAHIASACVVVDAKDAKSAAFYVQYGFVRILDTNHRLFLPIDTIRRMF